MISVTRSPLSLSLSLSLTLNPEGATSKENSRTALLVQQAPELRGESGQAGGRGVGAPSISKRNLMVSSGDKRTKSTRVLQLLIAAVDQDSVCREIVSVSHRFRPERACSHISMINLQRPTCHPPPRLCREVAQPDREEGSAVCTSSSPGRLSLPSALTKRSRHRWRRGHGVGRRLDDSRRHGDPSVPTHRIPNVKPLAAGRSAMSDHDVALQHLKR